MNIYTCMCMHQYETNVFLFKILGYFKRLNVEADIGKLFPMNRNQPTIFYVILIFRGKNNLLMELQ